MVVTKQEVRSMLGDEYRADISAILMHAPVIPKDINGRNDTKYDVEELLKALQSMRVKRDSKRQKVLSHLIIRLKRYVREKK